MEEQHGRHAEQQPDRIDRALSAHDEEGVFLQPAGHRCDDGVNGEAEGEQNRESADVFHFEFVPSSKRSASRTSFGPELKASRPFSFGAWLRTWTRISLALCWHERRRPDLIFHRRAPARCP